MRGWVNFCWVVTILCTLAATVVLGAAFNATAAPAQAAAAAMACGMVIIPYVFTRAFDLWERGEQVAAIRNALEAATRKPLPDIITPAELLAANVKG